MDRLKDLLYVMGDNIDVSPSILINRRNLARVLDELPLSFSANGLLISSIHQDTIYVLNYERLSVESTLLSVTLEYYV